MEKNRRNEIEYLTFQAFRQTGLVKHLFSTRLGGVSKGIYSSMNLSFTRGDDPTDVMENYKKIAEILECKVEDMVCSDQTHTQNIRVVTNQDKGKGIVVPKDYTDIDGLITNQPDIVLVTFYADCVPLYFLDSTHKAIGLAHSGWRGTVGKIGRSMMESMEREYGTQKEDLLVAIGPSICKNCYEVSEDVAEEFKDAFTNPEVLRNILLKKEEAGKYQLDLWQANYEIFKEAGLKDRQISLPEICTCCNPDYLFSHRASHGKRGNLGAFLGLRNI